MNTNSDDAIRLIQSGLDKLGHSPGTIALLAAVTRIAFTNDAMLARLDRELVPVPLQWLCCMPSFIFGFRLKS